MVCLHVPSDGTEDKEALNKLLGGGRDTPHLSFYGTVAWVERPMPRRGFLWRWRNPRIVDWLTQSGGVPRDQALAILQRLNIPAAMRIGLVPWNQRTWVALEAAMTRGADIVVLDTGGNGWDGIQVAYELITPRLDRCAVIRVSHPSNRARDCYATAKCVELGITEESTPWTTTGTVPAPSTPL
jgi:hypothetical protein